MASAIPEPHPVRPVRKRRWRWILIWLSLDLAVAIVLIGLLLHRPAAYRPMVPGADANDPQHVDRYLTGLSAELYNGAQTRSPFDLLVLEEGINQAIASERWSDPLQDASISGFSVIFSPEGIVAMGTASLKGASFVVTIGIEPKIDPQGLLALHVTRVKVGALALTPLARMMAGRMYAQRLAAVPVDTEDIRTLIAGALLDDKAFEPVLLLRNRRVRLESLQLQKGQILLRFGPADGR